MLETRRSQKKFGVVLLLVRNASTRRGPALVRLRQDTCVGGRGRGRAIVLLAAHRPYQKLRVKRSPSGCPIRKTTRRLILDEQTLEALLQGWPLIQITGKAGIPPEIYRFTYNLSGLCVSG